MSNDFLTVVTTEKEQKEKKVAGEGNQTLKKAIISGKTNIKPVALAYAMPPSPKLRLHIISIGFQDEGHVAIPTDSSILRI